MKSKRKTEGNATGFETEGNVNGGIDGISRIVERVNGMFHHSTTVHQVTS
jgi:hypothetical protein